MATTIPSNWHEHHREDGELLGWICEEHDAFAPVDLLGRIGQFGDWLAAEQALDLLGIGCLSDLYALET
ncbi:hypothetical protein [Bifidobacterium tsurumiense]|uniref:Uncharacterized protein n=1 Tax=Bifidobacterium tsurumiense TaxID=356829 RepID=A0A087EEE7_9BIFI|nr:hypothetical protein [Bifidobacterium tsurumiense]KFJ06148.1 hypothetical protein BITS_1017 [Bifidobacterium tsurumiense]MDY4678793.1 hypothetical protein [Bifidobacterium tsurumiense]MSS11967.1 hypothetical protein [Bifidobacterium tsurumiense]